jgi:hypothetical protein
MQPGTLNLTVRQGDTFTQVLTIANAATSDPTGRTPGTPVDLTGCEAEMTIVATYNTAPSYSLNSLTATTNGGMITLGGAAGTVTITIPPADSAALNNGSYDLKIKFTDGSISTFVAGGVFFERGVTQWT